MAASCHACIYRSLALLHCLLHHNGEGNDGSTAFTPLLQYTAMLSAGRCLLRPSHYPVCRHKYIPKYVLFPRCCDLQRSLPSKAPGAAARPFKSASAAGGSGPPAVDIRPVAGQRNLYCCVMPGLNSAHPSVSGLSNGLARAMGGERTGKQRLWTARSMPVCT